MGGIQEKGKEHIRDGRSFIQAFALGTGIDAHNLLYAPPQSCIVLLSALKKNVQ